MPVNDTAFLTLNPILALTQRFTVTHFLVLQAVAKCLPLGVSSPSFPYLDPPSYCYHLLLTSCCGPLSTGDLRVPLNTLARMVVAFLATIGATSFIAPAMDLLYPFAPSPADSVLTAMFSTNIASFTFNLGIVMDHCKQDGECCCSWLCWLTLTMV